MKPVILALLLFASLPAVGEEGAGSAATGRNVSRVLFLGDSITVGVGVKDRATERYSAVTTRLLQEHFPGCIEVNLGRSGRALCEQDADYADEILRQKPDAVVIQWGVNDHYWGYSIAQFAARYEKLVATLRAARPGMPIAAATLIADFRWPENPDRWIAEANTAIQEIAARYGCQVADLHFALAHDRSFYADQIHPNAAGAAKMAEAIAAALTTPPPAKPSVRFDRGREIRFLQNVFLPAWPDDSPGWIRVSDISGQGMRIETAVPLQVRTAPQYSAGAYQITVRDKAGAVVVSAPAEAKSRRFLQFALDPAGREGPFTVEIAVLPPAK